MNCKLTNKCNLLMVISVSAVRFCFLYVWIFHILCGLVRSCKRSNFYDHFWGGTGAKFDEKQNINPETVTENKMKLLIIWISHMRSQCNYNCSDVNNVNRLQSQTKHFFRSCGCHRGFSPQQNFVYYLWRDEWLCFRDQRLSSGELSQ